MKKNTRLSETEMEVMQVIWELPTPATVSQILNVFEVRKGWKTSTLSTLMARLIEKGFLTKEMKGKVNYYYTLLTLEEYKNRETQSLISNLYGGVTKNLLAALIQTDGISQRDIDDLRQWFESQTSEE